MPGKRAGTDKRRRRPSLPRRDVTWGRRALRPLPCESVGEREGPSVWRRGESSHWSFIYDRCWGCFRHRGLPSRVSSRLSVWQPRDGGDPKSVMRAHGLSPAFSDCKRTTCGRLRWRWLLIFGIPFLDCFVATPGPILKDACQPTPRAARVGILSDGDKTTAVLAVLCTRQVPCGDDGCFFCAQESIQ
jgi:hypothetical protein